MIENNKESKYNRINQLLFNLAQKSKYMEDLLVEIENSTDEDYRIKCEINFKNYTDDCVSLVRLIQEEAGFFKCFSGVPPEQYNQPPYERKDCLDLPENKQLVDTFFDTIKSDTEDLEWHKTDRVYVLNKEEGKYDVVKEKLETPERRIFSELEDETHSIEEWQDVVKDFTPEWGHDKNIFDEDIISAAYAFMVGPVGIQRKKVIAAESRKYSSLEELKQDILTEAKEKDMVLYMTYAYQVADPRDINKYSFKVTENYPKITMYCWRGVFLDKE